MKTLQDGQVAFQGVMEVILVHLKEKVFGFVGLNEEEDILLMSMS
ncbi:hypothetical protein [Nitrosomonas supralitoralis]|nr:hypothetical protein [Nitrosomonas supralitoralis]